MLADQDAVPAAIPVPPAELVHLTAATATLSLAVPLMATDGADFEVMVIPGALSCSEGGVLSPGTGEGAGAGVGAGTGGVGVGVVGGVGGADGGGMLLPYSARIPAMSSSLSPVESL